MFRVFHINFGNYADGEHGTVEEALEAGKRAGFEFSVRGGPVRMDRVVATWSPLYGTKRFDQGGGAR